MSEDIKLPRYQCHKKVYALKIAAIEFEPNLAKIAFVDEKYAVMYLNNYREKFKGDENDLGYFIQYDDGYVSWSPSKVFEDGYTLI